MNSLRSLQYLQLSCTREFMSFGFIISYRCYHFVKFPLNSNLFIGKNHLIMKYETQLYKKNHNHRNGKLLL